MKRLIMTALCIVALNVFAEEKLQSVKFEKADVQVALDFYGKLTGQRIDLVQGEHQPITFELKKVYKEEILQKIEAALTERNLKLYKISDEHLIASWIKVPEKKQPPLRKTGFRTLQPNQEQ